MCTGSGGAARCGFCCTFALDATRFLIGAVGGGGLDGPARGGGGTVGWVRSITFCRVCGAPGAGGSFGTERLSLLLLRVRARAAGTGGGGM